MLQVTSLIYVKLLELFSTEATVGSNLSHFRLNSDRNPSLKLPHLHFSFYITSKFRKQISIFISICSLSFTKVLIGPFSYIHVTAVPRHSDSAPTFLLKKIILNFLRSPYSTGKLCRYISSKCQPVSFYNTDTTFPSERKCSIFAL